MYHTRRKRKKISLPNSSDSEKGRRRDFVLNLISVGVIGLENHPVKNDFIESFTDIPFSEIHVDSLTHIQIAILVEEKYGLPVSPVQISELGTLKSLFEMISEDN
jgi:acyl carrier protein